MDPNNGRPAKPPRLAKEKAPRIPAAGAIPQDPEAMPDEISYDASKKRLLVGGGYIENVSPEIWSYDVSGKQVLSQWFSYRKRNREKPPMGDKRPPSELCKIQPESWLAEYTTELLNVLHVLGRLVELEESQRELLVKICSGPTITLEELKASEALTVPAAWRKKLAADPLHQAFFPPVMRDSGIHRSGCTRRLTFTPCYVTLEVVRWPKPRRGKKGLKPWLKA